MKKFSALIFAALLPLMLSAPPAMASTDDLAAIQKAGIIRIGTEGTYAPFSYHDPKDNKLVGFDVDIGRSIDNQLGVNA